ncbi:unnamed protein product [Closterium sp. Naga37s-1]|nr:unnamed protein product [Closterium sp. Naga37s-1]
MAEPRAATAAAVVAKPVSGEWVEAAGREAWERGTRDLSCLPSSTGEGRSWQFTIPTPAAACARRVWHLEVVRVHLSSNLFTASHTVNSAAETTRRLLEFTRGRNAPRSPRAIPVTCAGLRAAASAMCAHHLSRWTRSGNGGGASQ